MKWRYVDRMMNWTHEKYWTGKKKGITVKLYKERSGYWFLANNADDSFVYNSLWESHPNPVAPLMGKCLNLTLSEMQKHVENWIDMYAPKKVLKEKASK